MPFSRRAAIRGRPPTPAWLSGSARAPPRPSLRWPLDAWSCAAVRASDIPRCYEALGRRALRPGGRRAEGLHPAEEPLEQAVGLVWPLDLRDVAAAVEDDLLG